MDVMIDESDGGLWVAATDKGRLQGLEIDPVRETVRWGAIYRAKVVRIDKALDAAFLDLDGRSEGILHNADLRLPGKDGGIEKNSGNIAKKLRPGQMLAVQAKTGYIPREADFDFMREDKIAQVSMDITIQGRFLVYAPLMEENRISSRIHGTALRTQLTDMLGGFAPLKGLILRAASEDTQGDVLLREAKILSALWEELRPSMKGDTPALIQEGPGAIARMLSDQAGQTIERIEVVTMERYASVEEWCATYAPDLVARIRSVTPEDADDDLALFDHRGILGDIEDLFQEYGLLPGGGSLIIQQTAAFTAVDVNRGGDTRPAPAVNAEAAGEIARQMRLRNLGGIILIDFLKMATADRKEFSKTLTDAFAGDPCTVQIHGFTALGILEITRKRRTVPLSERMDAIELAEQR